MVEALVALLAAGVTPVIPEHGSVGASGDLAQLAHLALPLLGEGEVLVDGRRVPAAEGLRLAGLAPLRLSFKEGLSLVNGTEGMLALACLAVADAEALAAMADVACAMSIEGLLGTDRPFQARLHELRPHPGQVASAANLRTMLAGSPILKSHRHSDHAIQDAYSLRCAPRSTGPAGTWSPSPARWSSGSWARSPTTRWCSPRPTRSSPSATSTASRSPSCSTSWPSPWPSWPTSPSGGSTGCSTRPSTTTCRRSWPATRASTRA